MGTLNEKLEYLSQTKEYIKEAIISKGQPVSSSDTFRSYASKIAAIENGDVITATNTTGSALSADDRVWVNEDTTNYYAWGDSSFIIYTVDYPAAVGSALYSKNGGQITPTGETVTGTDGTTYIENQFDPEMSPETYNRYNEGDESVTIYSIIPSKSVTSTSFTAIAQANIANNASGSVKTILDGNGTYAPTLGTKVITRNNTYSASIDDLYGYSSVTVNVEDIPAVVESLSITPTTSAQSFTPTSGVDGYAPVTVSAVDSTIDQNIIAGNIKSGVSILGVNGSVTELNGETLSVTPSTVAQTLNPTSPKNAFTEVSVSAVTSLIDANITAGNIKSGVEILGVEGTYSGETPVLQDKVILANGEYTADEGYDGIGTATVAVNATGATEVATNRTGASINSGDKVWVNQEYYAAGEQMFPARVIAWNTNWPANGLFSADLTYGFGYSGSEPNTTAWKSLSDNTSVSNIVCLLDSQYILYDNNDFIHIYSNKTASPYLCIASAGVSKNITSIYTNPMKWKPVIGKNNWFYDTSNYSVVEVDFDSDTITKTYDLSSFISTSPSGLFKTGSLIWINSIQSLLTPVYNGGKYGYKRLVYDNEEFTQSESLYIDNPTSTSYTLTPLGVTPDCKNIIFDRYNNVAGTCSIYNLENKNWTTISMNGSIIYYYPSTGVLWSRNKDMNRGQSLSDAPVVKVFRYNSTSEQMDEINVNGSNYASIYWVSADLNRIVYSENWAYSASYYVSSQTRILGNNLVPYNQCTSNTITGTAAESISAGATGNVYLGDKGALQSKVALQNGTITPDSGYYGLESVTVNVVGTGTEFEVTNLTGETLESGDKVWLSPMYLGDEVDVRSNIISSGSSSNYCAVVSRDGTQVYFGNGTLYDISNETTQSVTPLVSKNYIIKYSNNNLIFAYSATSSYSSAGNTWAIISGGNYGVITPYLYCGGDYYYDVENNVFVKMQSGTMVVDKTYTTSLSVYNDSMYISTVYNDGFLYIRTGETTITQALVDDTNLTIMSTGKTSTIGSDTFVPWVTSDGNYFISVMRSAQPLPSVFNNYICAPVFYTNDNGILTEVVDISEICSDLSPYYNNKWCSIVYNEQDNILTCSLQDSSDRTKTTVASFKYNNGTFTKISSNVVISTSDDFSRNTSTSDSTGTTFAIKLNYNTNQIFINKGPSVYKAISYQNSNVSADSITGFVTEGGIDKATVKVGAAFVPTLETLTVTPTTSAQTITPTTGIDGYDEITVSAVTSSIDANILAGNIKNGVEILGVEGTYAGEAPTLEDKVITSNGTYTASTGYDGIGEATVAVNATGDTQEATNRTGVVINAGDKVWVNQEYYAAGENINANAVWGTFPTFGGPRTGIYSADLIGALEYSNTSGQYRNMQTGSIVGHGFGGYYNYLTPYIHLSNGYCIIEPTQSQNSKYVQGVLSDNDIKFLTNLPVAVNSVQAVPMVGKDGWFCDYYNGYVYELDLSTGNIINTFNGCQTSFVTSSNNYRCRLVIWLKDDCILVPKGSTVYNRYSYDENTNEFNLVTADYRTVSSYTNNILGITPDKKYIVYHDGGRYEAGGHLYLWNPLDDTRKAYTISNIQTYWDTFANYYYPDTGVYFDCCLTSTNSDATLIYHLYEYDETSETFVQKSLPTDTYPYIFGVSRNLDKMVWTNTISGNSRIPLTALTRILGNSLVPFVQTNVNTITGTASENISLGGSGNVYLGAVSKLQHEKIIRQNGIYTADTGYDGIASVDVAIGQIGGTYEATNKSGSSLATNDKVWLNYRPVSIDSQIAVTNLTNNINKAFLNPSTDDSIYFNKSSDNCYSISGNTFSTSSATIYNTNSFDSIFYDRENNSVTYSRSVQAQKIDKDGLKQVSSYAYFCNGHVKTYRDSYYAYVCVNDTTVRSANSGNTNGRTEAWKDPIDGKYYLITYADNNSLGMFEVDLENNSLITKQSYISSMDFNTENFRGFTSDYKYLILGKKVYRIDGPSGTCTKVSNLGDLTTYYQNHSDCNIYFDGLHDLIVVFPNSGSLKTSGVFKYNPTSELWDQLDVTLPDINPSSYLLPEISCRAQITSDFKTIVCNSDDGTENVIIYNLSNDGGWVITNYNSINQDSLTGYAAENIAAGATGDVIIGEEIENQNKSITSDGLYTADEGYTGLGTVTVTAGAVASATTQNQIAEELMLINDGAVALTVNVSPTTADFALTSSTNHIDITPTSSSGGTYVFNISANNLKNYTYSASKLGYTTSTGTIVGGTSTFTITLDEESESE